MNATAIESTGAPSGRMAYTFDVIPTAVLAAHRDGNLTTRDLLVVSQMIHIARWDGRADSCWCTRDVLARRLGVSSKTIQVSWRRLKAQGWIIEEVVGAVDPLDPRNRTGRRYRFGWLAENWKARAGGETKTSPPPRKTASPNRRNALSPEKTTVTVVVLDSARNTEEPKQAEAIGGGASPVSPEPNQPPHDRAEITPLPAPLAEALASPALGEPLRRQIGRMLPRWLAAHPVERVAAALRAMVEAARRRQVRSPIGFLVGTLRNMEAEGAGATELAPPPPPTRTPDADRTSERLAEIRRGESEAGERERRWSALPESDRRRIEAEVEAANPRPPGMPPRLWGLTRRMACLEHMDEASRVGAPH